MVLPLIVALIYKEPTALHFLATIIATAVTGGVLMLTLRKHSTVIYAREGFAIVSISWIALSLFGALPFFLSNEIPNYIDAFFETVSGFTTTGASILENVEALSHGMLSGEALLTGSAVWEFLYSIWLFLLALPKSLCIL